MSLFSIRSFEDVRREVGVPQLSLGQLEANAPLQPIALSFSAIAAGAALQDEEKVPAGNALIVSMITGYVGLDVAATAIAGTPLLREPSPTVGSNTHHPSGLVLVNIHGDNYNLFKEQVPWDALVGTADKPFILPVPLMLPGGSGVRLKGTNGTAVSIKGTVVLWGRLVRGN